MRTGRFPALVLASVLIPAAAALAQTTTPLAGIGPNNAITDVEGVEVGQVTKEGGGFLTGATAVVTRGGAVGGVDVRGGGPGTRETDLLDPRNLVQRVDAISLAGGSAYGLEAATGVMRYLEEQMIGYQVGFTPDQVVPIVPGAIIFDLARGGDFTARPTAQDGYDAAAAAATGLVEQGTVGAGTGAVAGGFKGGVGTASVDLGNGIVVAALAVVNAVGSTFDPVTCELYGAFLELDDEFGTLQTPSPEDCVDSGGGLPTSFAPSAEDVQPLNTTIGVVATNIALTKAQAQKMAGIAHDGMARAIRPSHTLLDGDTVFALATGRGNVLSECQTEAVFPADIVCALALNDIYAAAADAFSRAVVHAMLNARSVGETTSYCDAFPTANCPDGTGGGGGPTTGGTPGGTPPAGPDPPLPAPDDTTPVTGGGAIALATATVLLAAALRRRR